MANSKSWKSEERVFAAALGLKRNANNGQRQRDIGKDADDISIEHKKRADMPQWWEHAWEQALAGANADQMAVVGISHARGRGYGTARYVVLRLEDFAKLRAAICRDECAAIAQEPAPIPIVGARPR